MARPKKRTQQLRQSAKNATKSRQPIKYDIPSDLDPAPDPGTDASIEEFLVSHEEHSPHCSHDHHSPDPDNRTWDFDLGDELPDLDCDSDDEREEMDDQVVAAPEISEESELKKFATLLSDAQEAARIKERAQETNRPKKYNGNSSKTKYRQRKFGKEMEAKGFLNVFDFLKAKAKIAAQEPVQDHNSPVPPDEPEELPNLEQLSDAEPEDEPEVQDINRQGSWVSFSPFVQYLVLKFIRLRLAMKMKSCQIWKNYQTLSQMMNRRSKISARGVPR
jgi:hypothetical protein